MPSGFVVGVAITVSDVSITVLCNPLTLPERVSTSAETVSKSLSISSTKSSNVLNVVFVTKLSSTSAFV